MPRRDDWKPGDKINLDMTFAATTVADMPEGYIAGIASTPATDLYGHKVLAHAFDKSIRRKGLSGPRGVKLLAYHDWSKPAGVIKKLKTEGEDLNLEAQLNLNVSYVKDMYEVARQNSGLNFSVGFMLEEFDFVDEKDAEDNEYLLIKQGDLMEVSVVVFPAQLEAEMTFIKHAETLSELEKALVAQEFCRSRNEAQKMAKYLKANSHLFLDKQTPVVEHVDQPTHPLLDVKMMQPVRDQLAKIKALL
jgi:HK97 family phage prohead protease